MHSVDPDFKMSYDIRNDQEAAVRRQRRDAPTPQTEQRAGQPTNAEEIRDSKCDLNGFNGMRWACLTGLALLGVGVGYQLGQDQFGNRKDL